MGTEPPWGPPARVARGIPRETIGGIPRATKGTPLRSPPWATPVGNACGDGTPLGVPGRMLSSLQATHGGPPSPFHPMGVPLAPSYDHMLPEIFDLMIDSCNPNTHFSWRG